MAERKRVCCNCGNNIRTNKDGLVECHCAIDGHRIGYVACFEHWCRKWKKDSLAKDLKKVFDHADHHD